LETDKHLAQRTKL